MKRLIPIIAVLILAAGCAVQEAGDIQENPVQENEVNQEEAVTIKLTSPAFENNGAIPPEYTCDDGDISPELGIEGVPENAKSLALIVDDPDAPRGTFVHWVIWNIPPGKVNIAKGEQMAPSGRNDFGKEYYSGPCPPAKHRYFFKLYALDAMLDLPAGSSKADLENAMKGYIIAEARLVGTYER